MIDKFNRKIEYVRISLTDRCNLRCKYCMPESGVLKLKHEEILTLEEILHVVKILAELGIKKIRLTGGEPLLRKGIVNLVREIKSIEEIAQVVLTTNGVLLDDMVDDLVNAGLDGVNLSLDTLNADIFNEITRRKAFSKVLNGLQKIIDKNLDVKINCVPIANVNESDIIKLVSLVKDNDIKMRFIELMPIGCASQFKGISMSAVKSHIENVYGTLEPIERQNHLQGPAEYFKLTGFKGQIGFIDAIEHKFCGSCNRIRLTSDGFLKLCLNSSDGVDLKSLLRSGVDDKDLIDKIKYAIYNKPREHHFGKVDDNSKMYQIGG